MACSIVLNKIWASHKLEWGTPSSTERDSNTKITQKKKKKKKKINVKNYAW
jgi:hypothetical protein